MEYRNAFLDNQFSCHWKSSIATLAQIEAYLHSDAPLCLQNLPQGHRLVYAAVLLSDYGRLSNGRRGIL